MLIFKLQHTKWSVSGPVIALTKQPGTLLKYRAAICVNISKIPDK